ncbi:MAG: hypothetical protein ACHP7K_08340 [Actinomycetales bacterium]
MKKLRTFLAIATLILTFGVVSPASASAAPYCGITWGSLNKTVSAGSSAPVVGVRAGQHDCYDRMVIDLNGPTDQITVGYYTGPKPMTSQGSGQPFMTWAGETLAVTVFANSPGYNPANRFDVVNVNGFRTFREIAFDSSFEGHTNFGLGVRARLPFRVFTLGERLVIDVGHRW